MTNSANVNSLNTSKSKYWKMLETVSSHLFYPILSSRDFVDRSRKNNSHFRHMFKNLDLATVAVCYVGFSLLAESSFQLYEYLLGVKKEASTCKKS